MQDAKYFRQSFNPKLTGKKKKHKNLTGLVQVVLTLSLMIITNCTWFLFWWLCDDGTSKRKSEEPRVTPIEKKPRDGDQIGGGEVEKPQDDDDGHCQLTSACTITWGKSNSNHEKIRSASCCSLYDVNLNPFSIIFRRNLTQKIEGLKEYISVKVRFVKPTSDGEDSTTETRFQSLFMTTVNSHEVESQQQDAKQKVIQSLLVYQKDRSDWALNEILHLGIKYVSVYPAKRFGLHFITVEVAQQKPTISNTNSDNKCLGFMWSVLAAIHPLQKRNNLKRLYHYQRFQGKSWMTFDRIEFPVMKDKVSKFER